MALIWLPAPVSCTGTQSQAVAEQDVLQPLDWLSHTNSPPATQWLTLVMSALYGAMKRGFGSHGLETKIGFRQDGEIVEYASVLPSDRPPLTVHAAVVGRVQRAPADGQRVLVGVRGVRAGVVGRDHAPAGIGEVPVRARGRPGGTGVRGLVDLLKVDEEMRVVGRVDDERLVVPRLCAGCSAGLRVGRIGLG